MLLFRTLTIKNPHACVGYLLVGRGEVVVEKRGGVDKNASLLAIVTHPIQWRRERKTQEQGQQKQQETGGV